MRQLTISILIVISAIIASSVILYLDSVKEETRAMPSMVGEQYREISLPAGFVNTVGQPVTLEEYVGKNVILLEFMSYTCANCQRSFPHVVEWYEKYKDKGLVVIGIHTPNFAFEHEIENVEAAMEKSGITFPVILDNGYGTWNAYGNQFWPRTFLIDMNGRIVYDHIGGGDYEETEAAIIQLLEQ